MFLFERYLDDDELTEGARVMDSRDAIQSRLEEMGFEIEASHHEVAEGQHEVNFKYADALTACDNTVTFKWVVKAIAAKYGLHATFMCRPALPNLFSSGWHLHQFLTKNGKNVFDDADGYAGLRVYDITDPANPMSVGGYDTSGYAYTISAKAGNVLPGDTKRYQCWYRTSVSPPCGLGVNDFNLSNGYEITWTP